VHGGRLPEDLDEGVRIVARDRGGIERVDASRILAGPAKADSIVTCWSSSIPSRRARSSSVRRASAAASPVR
jgi:hypothetical protein